MNDRWFLVAALAILFIPLAFAQHGTDGGLESGLHARALTIITIVAIIVSVVTLVSIVWKDKGPAARWVLFLAIVLPVAVATLYSAGSTIYLNLNSHTQGPVHWHVDFEIWNCGQMVDLRDPTGMSNRLGTSTLHEHNDNRIHIEGVVVKPGDVTLAEFFRVIGGELAPTAIKAPTNDGYFEASNGDTCPGGAHGTLQVFRIYEENGAMKQQKLSSFTDYAPAPYGIIPPGDCLIIEFAPNHEKTDHVCTSYQVAVKEGKINGG